MLQTQQPSGLVFYKGSGAHMPLPHTVVFTTANGDSDEVASAASRSALTGCRWHDGKAMLREVRLRPTRQRMALGWMLFGKGDRDVTAEVLYEDAAKGREPVTTCVNYS